MKIFDMILTVIISSRRDIGGDSLIAFEFLTPLRWLEKLLYPYSWLLVLQYLLHILSTLYLIEIDLK
jgi:hypothetical protein